jgi:hypothetical protein
MSELTSEPNLTVVKKKKSQQKIHGDEVKWQHE